MPGRLLFASSEQTGTPLSDLQARKQSPVTFQNSNPGFPIERSRGLRDDQVTGMNSIRFVRYRMLYGRASYGEGGKIQHGLRPGRKSALQPH